MQKITLGLLGLLFLLFSFNNCAPPAPPSLLSKLNSEDNKGLNELCGKTAANLSPARSQYTCNDNYCVDCATGEYFTNKMTVGQEQTP